MMTTQSQRSRRSEFCCFCYSHAATCSVVLLVAFASVALSAAVGESAAAAQQQQQQSSGRNQAAPIQQQQQAAAVAPPPPPPLQSIDSSQQPNLASSSSGGQQPVGSGQQQQLQQQRPKLPNINLYISKNEMRKLLGIESPINYVTNGNIDTYPFKFSIPLGYNQSDIVFTWQNLGHTNVNYSISLVINKIHAIDPPLINITRSGLIPRHEQVFKITVPCSGKTTDDVDVQVLINILGFVPLEASPVQQPNIRQQSDQDEATPNMDLGGVAGLQRGNASAAPASNSIQDSAMQADAPEPQMRLVSHTLAIKRHKICAMHPVLFDHRQTTPTPLGGRAEIVRPPNQQPNQQPPVSPQPAPQVNYGPTPSATAADSRWTHESAPVSPPTPANHFIRHPTPSPAIEPTIVEPPAHHPHLNVPPATPMGPRKPAPEPPAAWPSPRQPPPSNQLGPENPLAEILFRQQQQQHHHHHHQPTGYNPLFWSLLSLSLIVSIAAILLLLFLNGAAAVGPTGKPLNNKLAMLKSLLVRRSHHPHSGHLKHAGHHHHRTMSINSQHSSMLKARHQHSPIMAKSAIIGTLRMSRPKSSASSLSGLSAVDLANELNLHQHHQQKSAQFYSYKAQKNSISPPAGTNMTRAYPTGFYSGTSSQTLSQHSANSNANNYQHHHYQQPPTADLLGTGYQCQAYQQQQQQHPIYHIATNNNQTTRLIWNNNGNGANSGAFTIDAGSYMPLTDAPKSDSGSVYQTIY